MMRFGPFARFPAAFALAASLALHAGVITSGVIFSRTSPPVPISGDEAPGLILTLGALPDAELRAFGPNEEKDPPGRAEKSLAEREESVILPPPARKERRAVPAGRKPVSTARPPADAAQPERPGGGQVKENGGTGGHGEGFAQGYGDAGAGDAPVPVGARGNPRPAYPEIARRRGQEGEVMVLAHVDAQGNPATVLIDASSGYPLLDRAAVAAIRHWKFHPAYRNGQAVPGMVRVPVSFHLR